ncbi:MAG: hypothetical protein ABL993_05190 [Vicinamibacterales bacterium]
MRGRPKKPTELKVLAGTPGRRPLPENEAQFTAGEIAPPAWLDDREKPWRISFLAEWERITAQLRTWAVIGEVNQGALEGICSCYASFVDAAKSRNNVEMRQAFEAYRKALTEFGLTPASKGRVSTGLKPAGGKLAKYTG